MPDNNINNSDNWNMKNVTKRANEGWKSGGTLDERESEERLNVGVLEDNKQWFEKCSVGRNTFIESRLSMAPWHSPSSHRSMYRVSSWGTRVQVTNGLWFSGKSSHSSCLQRPQRMYGWSPRRQISSALIQRVKDEKCKTQTAQNDVKMMSKWKKNH